MNIFLALAAVIVLGAVLYGVWVLLAKIPALTGTPHAIAGILLLLIWGALVWYFFFEGRTRVGDRTPAYPLFRYAVDFRPLPPPPTPTPIWL